MTFFRRIPIKKFTAYYLALLLLVAVVTLRAPERLIPSAAIVAIYVIADLTITYAKKRIWYTPLSSVISGLILGLVASPTLSAAWIVALPLLAVIAKRAFKFGRIRHLVNPAGFALAVSSLVAPTVSWWGVSWSNSITYVIAAVGVYIVWRLKRFNVAVPFILTYGILMALQIGPSSVPRLLWDGTTLFFVTVMLIEPITSAFPSKRVGMMYGALTGLIAYIFSAVSVTATLDPLLAAPTVSGIICGFIWTIKNPVTQS